MIVVYNLTNRGFYSELNNLLLASIYAESQGAKFFVDIDNWNSGRLNAKDFFFWNVPKCEFYLFPHRSVFVKGLSYYLNKLLAYILYRVRIEQPQDYFITMRTAEFWRNNFRYGIRYKELLFIKKSNLAKQFFVLNKNLQIIASSRFKNYKELQDVDYCCVHVRRGDKISSGEMHDIPISNYVHEILKFNIPHVIVFSDTSSAFEQISASLPSKFKIYNGSLYASDGFIESEYRSMSADKLKSDTINLLAEMYIFSKAKYMICTFSSNLSRYAALFLELENCKSLDCEWNPF